MKKSTAHRRLALAASKKGYKVQIHRNESENNCRLVAPDGSMLATTLKINSSTHYDTASVMEAIKDIERLNSNYISPERRAQYDSFEDIQEVESILSQAGYEVSLYSFRADSSGRSLIYYLSEGYYIGIADDGRWDGHPMIWWITQPHTHLEWLASGYPEDFIQAAKEVVKALKAAGVKSNKKKPINLLDQFYQYDSVDSADVTGADLYDVSQACDSFEEEVGEWDKILVPKTDTGKAFSDEFGDMYSTMLLKDGRIWAHNTGWGEISDMELEVWASDNEVQLRSSRKRNSSKRRKKLNASANPWWSKYYDEAPSSELFDSEDEAKEYENSISKTFRANVVGYLKIKPEYDAYIDGHNYWLVILDNGDVIPPWPHHPGDWTRYEVPRAAMQQEDLEEIMHMLYIARGGVEDEVVEDEAYSKFRLLPDAYFYVPNDLDDAYRWKKWDVYEEEDVGRVVYYVLQEEEPTQDLADRIFEENPDIQKVYAIIRDKSTYDLEKDLERNRGLQSYSRK